MAYKKNSLLVLLMVASFSLTKTNDDKPNCLICFDPLYDKKNDVVTLACSGKDQKHEFHFKCIHKWQQRKPECAYCRSSLNSETKQRLFDHSIDKPDDFYTKNLINFFQLCCCGSIRETIDEEL